jgi:hypothetical protein
MYVFTRFLIFLTLLLLPRIFFGQEEKMPPVQQAYIYFPYPMQEKKWHESIGFALTSLPEDVTEEVQVRAPVGDFHVLRKLNKNFYIDGQIYFQIVQNHISIGPRFARKLSDRFSFSIGDDFAWWFGRLNVASFATKGRGWLNYPNASLGIRMKKNVLLTIKGETIIKLAERYEVGGELLKKNSNQFSGYVGSVIMEQPLYGKKSVTIGFKAMYSNFFWQTWPLFETFDRNIFYPQITVGFIL